MSLKAQAIRGLLWSGVQTWGNQAGSLLVFFVLARLLSPEAFGLMAIANIGIAFCQIFLQRGLSEVLIQRQTLTPEFLNTVFWVNLAIALLLMLLGLGTAEYIADLFQQPQLTAILQALCVLLPMLALSSVPQAFLERQFAFKAIALRQLIGMVLGGLVGVGMAWSGYGVWSLVGQQLVQEGVGLIVLWQASPWRPTGPFSLSQFSLSQGLSQGRELGQWAVPLLGFNLFNFLNSRTDDFLIGYFLGTVPLGYYSIAYRILGVLQQLLVQTSKQVALPTFSRLQTEPEECRRAFYRATQLTSAIAFPIFLGVSVLAPELIQVLFGNQWQPAAIVLQVLALAGLFQSISFFKSSIFLAMGKPMWSLWLAGLTFVLNAIGFAIAVPWGIVAVAAAFVIRGYLVFPIGQWAVSRLIHTPLLSYLRQFTAPLLAAVIMAGSLLLVKSFLGEFSDSLVIVMVSVLGAIVYSLLLFGLSPKLFQELSTLIHLVRSSAKPPTP
ncbi:MAG: lipopolysaccharide biosynthesis protein [Oculatellaceae cyanobacterium Prado106]|jgi:PST family polysaccharide transporter|nr:lipopolysaccharide biosynthesis protein [Oculatellaceae cyanobacterium Prado106]